jgi:hypothetical protein
MKIDRIVDTFLRSDYFANWQSETIEHGGYARPGSDACDRFDRCYDAAENGADGSTHREHISDMRRAWRDYIRDRHRGKLTEFYWRLDTAVSAHWDALEQWHTDNGSIDVEVG